LKSYHTRRSYRQIANRTARRRYSDRLQLNYESIKFHHHRRRRQHFIR